MESFIIIHKSILNNKKLSSNAKILYGSIFSLCKQNKVCFATNSYFKKELGFHERIICRLIQELTKEKLIISIVSKFNDNKCKRRITIIEKESSNIDKPF